MDERLRFVARLLEGEKMAALCAEFGISRKTGYKIYDRYKDCGVQGLTDRSRRPQRQINRFPAPLEARIVRLKREYPGWGAPNRAPPRLSAILEPLFASASGRFCHLKTSW
jgi:putative transposase